MTEITELTCGCDDICGHGTCAPEGMLECNVRNTLIDCIETSTMAMNVLKKANYAGDRKLEVAKVLQSHAVPIPPMFPGSVACNQYGRAIAEYIINPDSADEPDDHDADDWDDEEEWDEDEDDWDDEEGCGYEDDDECWVLDEDD